MGTDNAKKNTNKQLRRELMLINGKWTESAAGQFLEVETPIERGRVIGQVPRAQAEDVDNACKAAAAAFETWRRVPARERGLLMLKIAEELAGETEYLAKSLALEAGKAIRTEARGEAKGSADAFRYFGGLAGELKGETVPYGEGVLTYSRREPMGVVGGIIPWNGPLHAASVKIASAITAGNTMVLKPSIEATLCVLEMARICAKHLPPGVLNIITGTGKECGVMLAHHPLVRKLTFTGSTDAGRSIMLAGAERIVPSTLELGGKNPQIVFPDANDDRMAEGVIRAARFTTAGQSCASGTGVYIHESIYESFLEKMVRKTSQLKIGDPLDEATDIGTVINQSQFEKVCGYIKDGMSQPGVRVMTGGMPPKEGPLARGYYIPPTIFANVKHEWRIAREEIFGSVSCVIPWKDEEDVIRMANDSLYGLSGFIWTYNGARALRIAHAIESGWIQINQYGGILAGHSYGGYKQSGVGIEHSLEGMLESFTHRKMVTYNLTL